MEKVLALGVGHTLEISAQNREWSLESETDDAHQQEYASETVRLHGNIKGQKPDSS